MTRRAIAALATGLLALWLAAPVWAQEPCPEPKRPGPGTSALCPPTEVPDGTITATPVVCTIPSGGTVCSSSIHWTTVNASSVTVRAFSYATQTSQLFASGTSGTQAAPWITAAGFRFDLIDSGVTLASVDAKGNFAPSVSLTSPANGASFIAPAMIPLAASASDPDGTISKVEFFNGASSLAPPDTTSPYSFSWDNVPAGSYTLTAKATDNLGAVTTSAPVSVTVNAAPTSTVKLTAQNKLVDSTVTAPATASATFRLALAGKIRFQTSVGGLFVEQAPLDEWLEPEDGTEAANYEVWAQLVSGTVSAGGVNQWLPMGGVSARDWTLTRSAVGTSQTVINVRIRRIGTTTVLASTDVTLRATVTNPPPTVTLTSPANGTVVNEPGSFTLTASASDPNGTISQVEFLSDNLALPGASGNPNPDPTAPYGYTWNNVPAGTYVLTAKATDNLGAVTTSAPVTVTVNPAPTSTVALTAQNKLVDSTVTAPATASATFRLGAEGKLYFRTSVGGAFVEQSPLDEWLNPESTTEAANYEAWAQLVSGTLSAGTAGQWLRLNLVRDWTLTRTTVGTSQTVINVRIRRVGTTTVLASTDVTLKATVTNPPPTVTMTAPANGAMFDQGQMIALAASASDSNGTVAKVEFFRGETILIDSSPVTLRSGTSSNGVWGLDWPDAPVGTHSITALATDNDGAATTSAPVSVTVNAAPPPPPPPPPTTATPDPVSDAVGASAGEFRVDESGAATYSIPLFAAPGTAGVTPQLALSYSSQGGAGPLGQGWSIAGTSAISRCRASREAGDFLVAGQPVDGDPGPVNFTTSDKFCLDGQRLIAVADSPACPALAGATVTQLRTELESFQRVCAYTFVAANGPRFFTVERQDGSTSWYGDRRSTTGGGDGGVSEGYLTGTGSGQTDKIYLWAQTRFQDSTGNYIDYRYLKDPGGVDKPGEHLLSEVQYTGKVVLPGQGGSAIAPYASLVFDYEPLLSRRSFFAGSQVWQTRLLTSIRSINDGATVRYYRLNFPRLGSGLAPTASGSGSIQLASVTECRDESQAVCLAPTVFDWSPAKYEFATIETASSIANGSLDKFEGLKFADIDGDGRPDLVWAKDGKSTDPCPTDGIHVSFARLNPTTNEPFFANPPGSLCAPAELLDEPDNSWFLLDYDGDGRDDIFLRGSSAWVGYRSTGVNGPAGHPFDTSVNLLAGLSPAIAAGSDPEQQPQLADLNGDGLTDIVYARAGKLYARIMARGGAFGFAWGGEREVVFFDVANNPCSRISGTCSYAFAGLYHKDNYQQLIDFDGDARSDLLALIDVTSSQSCDATDPGPVPGPPGPPTEPQSDPFSPSNATCTRRQVFATVLDQVTATQVRARTYGNGLWNWIERTQERIVFADINGDGLSDILRLMPANRGFSSYTLNTGSGFGDIGGQSGGLINPDLDIPNIMKAQLVDVNGAGRASLVYPNTANSHMVRRGYSELAGGFGAEQSLPGGNAATGCTKATCLDGRSFLFGDYDADGAVDFLRIQWKNANSPVYTSRAGVTGLFKPRDVIVKITNGLGASTALSYLPMTNGAVYRREAGSRNSLGWGRGSPVQDFVAPLYLVHKATSSAPTFADANALSTIYYRYQGAKLQAGGRGFLGFAQVISVDVNTPGQHILSLTDYAQDYPFVGQPIRTRQRLVGGEFSPGACAITVSEANGCFRAAGDLFTDLGGGTLFADRTQLPEVFPAFAPGTQAPLHVRLAGSTEDGFDPTTGVRTSRVETTFAYDSWGNATLTAVDTFTGTSSIQTAAVTTSNTYTNDGAKWRLGRLTASTVTHSRPGLPNIVRSTSFAYDLAGPVTGLLTREQVQPGGGADKDLRTFYVLDQYGNRLETHTCSAQLSEAECTATAIAFQPTDALRIQRYSRQVFDARGRYVTAVWQPFWNGTGTTEAAVQTIVARNAFGDVSHSTDANGLDTVSVFGTLGRPYYAWVETVPGASPGNPAEGRESWTTYRWCGTGTNQVNCPTGAKFRQQVQTEGAPSQWTYFDLLGRPILSAGQSFNAGLTGQDFSAVCSFYDAHGRGSRTSEPFFLPLAASGGAPAFGGTTPCTASRFWTLNSYDAVGRPLQVDHPDSSNSQVAYTGLTTTFTDQRNNTRTETKNALGELVSATDAGGLTTTYAYDASGNLTSVSRDAGRGAIVNTQTYDALGRKTRQTDPDAGTWDYSYNALGEQIAQTDLLGQATRSRYDARGRVIARTSESSPGVVELTHSYVFDTGIGSKGQLAEESSTGSYAAWTGDATLATNFKRSYSYDSLGRPVGSITTIDSTGYPTLTRYDALGRAWQSQDASGNWLKTQFDARGYAAALCESSSGDAGTTCGTTSAGTYTRTLVTDARGNVVHERRGGTSALEVIRTFDRFTGRLESVCSGGSCAIQDDVYAFDAAGNLLSRDIGGQYREVFSYDPLNRLTLARYERVLSTTWSPGTGPISTQQAYDKLGNLCQKTIGASQENYGYGGRSGCGLGTAPGSGTTSATASPHAVTSAAGGAFWYDGHGNQTLADQAGTASDRFIRYTVEQQAHELALASQTSPTQRSRFWYGSDGQRFKREDSATGQSLKRTVYLGNVEIVQQAGLVTTKRYIAGIVVQDLQGATTTTQYLFHDHIGSIVRVTNAAGGILEGMDFGAFGERRGYVDPRGIAVVPTKTTRGFTGHEMVDGFDVVHMNGRIYDSKLGRFLQADPLIQEPNNGQNFNRYSYVLNNPLSYTDPSGFSFFKKFRLALGIAAAVFLPGGQGLLAASFGVSNAVAQFAITGFLTGVINSGTLKGGLIGAFTGALGAGIPGLGDVGDFLVQSSIAGLGSVLSGGKFGHGFASAGLTRLAHAAPGFDRIKGDVGKAAASALIGGTVSKLTGGKFANGALTGAMQSALISFKDALRSNFQEDGVPASTGDVTDGAPDELKPLLKDPLRRQEALNRLAELRGFSGQSGEILYSDEPVGPRGELGNVSPNGVVTIFAGAFDRSFGYLGSILFHEFVHVDQFNRYGRITSISDRIIREVEAYDLSLSDRNPFSSSLSGLETSLIELSRARHVNALSPTCKAVVESGSYDCF